MEIINTIETIINAQKKARKENNFFALLTNAEALLEYLPKLIEYSVDQESKYRKIEATLLETEKRAYDCEVKAKASEEYREWQKSRGFIELVYNLVNMSKVLAKSVLKEENL